MTVKQGPTHLTRSEAILAVSDVVATIRYYRHVLGFADEWTWGRLMLTRLAHRAT